MCFARLFLCDVFFFQAEDGIRDIGVTGVQTCALPIFGDPTLRLAFWLPERGEFVDAAGTAMSLPGDDPRQAATPIEHEGKPVAALVHDQIGRAACRERV